MRERDKGSERLLHKREKEMKDKRILEGRETGMKVERAGMRDDERRAEERDRKQPSVSHSANLNCEGKEGMH